MVVHKPDAPITVPFDDVTVTIGVVCDGSGDGDTLMQFTGPQRPAPRRTGAGQPGQPQENLQGAIDALADTPGSGSTSSHRCT